jgi:selenocysteine-specific elongation factor
VLRDRTTVGGGLVLDPAPPRHADLGRFDLLARGEIAALVHAPVRRSDVAHLVERKLPGVEEAGEWMFSRAWLEDFRAKLRKQIESADPLDPGIPPPAQPWARDIEPLLALERRGARLYLPGSAPALGTRAEDAEKLQGDLDASGFVPVRVEDPELGRYLEREGRLVRVGDGYAVGAAAYDEATRIAVEECERAGSITLARFRDLLGTGRRPAQLLLERFDADGLTRRTGEERVLRRRAKSTR